MVQLHPHPRVADVAVHVLVVDCEDLKRFCSLFHGLGFVEDIGKIGLEHHVFMLLVKSEFEGANLGFHGGVEVARVVEASGLDLTADENPVKFHASENVG